MLNGRAETAVRQDCRRSLTRREALFGAACAALVGGAHGRVLDEGDPYLAAYYFAFPVYEFARTAAASAAPPARRPVSRFNQVIHRRTLADHTARAVTTPNNDTLYSSARLDLSNGPVLADLPTVHDRYFSVAFMNARTDNFAYVGTRATGGVGGPTLIAGPRWRGEHPDGARLIRSSTDDVWMLARVLVSDIADLPAAHAVQEQIRIVASAEPEPLAVTPTSADDLENLIAVTNAMLARMSLEGSVEARVRSLSDVGLRPGDATAWARLSEAQRRRWREAATRGSTALRSGVFLRGRTVSGWHYPPPGIGSVGATDELRAAVALSGLAAPEAEEATYARADGDEGGEPLGGHSAYSLTIPANVPARAFWSLSMYQIEADGRLFFTRNPIGRYAISDRTQGLVRGTDGSVPIALQFTRPTQRESNWLPTPSGAFAIVFRAYLPEPAMLDGRWALPAVRRLAVRPQQRRA